MASPNPLPAFPGYGSNTVAFKSTAHGDIFVDILAPKVTSPKPKTVLVHYHGGFLVVGDRYTFLPYWLVNACVTRGWIFVTPDYRLLPESTAHSSLEDAMDAYKWTLNKLPEIFGSEIDSVILAGSSAGAYLALATATSLTEQPEALLLIYGMLDTTQDRYITAGANIFGRPVTETGSILAKCPMATKDDHRQMVSAHPVTADPGADPRFQLVSALHIDALFPDYMTGVAGLGQSIVTEGIGAIPENHRVIFPLAFSPLQGLPRTILLNGHNDSAVPVTQSKIASEKLRAAGVEVHTEFPDDAEHGFDARAGNINVEGEEKQQSASFSSLRKILELLDSAIQKREPGF